MNSALHHDWLALPFFRYVFGLDSFLKQNDPFEQSFRARRAPGHIHVDWDYLVNTFGY
jgi:hypothetical protein|tara:strand:- start:1722 stop:1895 length:174 start_codon:yes stop_codon:yes gene_type:complete